MGIYLNPGNAAFSEAVHSQIYVDKTELISYTNSVLATNQKNICVSRPRRFGKSITANMLAAYYYDYAMNCDNQFVSSWFEFNLNVNNLLSALTARKYKIEVAPNIVGNTEVSEAIRTSNARDFGISGTLEYFEQLLRISETDELVDRERKIDLLKWNWMEDAVFFNYFTVERIFVFLLRLEMIERWISLDKEKGSELFRKMIDSLKNEVQIPAEFR